MNNLLKLSLTAVVAVLLFSGQPGAAQGIAPVTPATPPSFETTPPAPPTTSSSSSSSSSSDNSGDHTNANDHGRNSGNNSSRRNNTNSSGSNSNTTQSNSTPGSTTAPAATSSDDDEPQDPIYDDNGEPYNAHYGLVHPKSVVLTLQRRPELKPEQFVLHINATRPVSGCMKFSALPDKVEFKNDVIEVTINPYNVDNRNVLLGEHSCVRRVQSPSADVILNRDDLISKGIKKITFDLDDGETSYLVDINKERVRLQFDQKGNTESVVGVLKISNVKYPLNHWFYPPDTVILSVPGAKPDQDVSAAVAAMAKAKGLQKLSDIWPDFRSPLVLPTFYYYVDKDGTLAKDPAIAEGVPAGTISVPKTVYGLEHDETVQQDLPVYARAPGTYE